MFRRFTLFLHGKVQVYMTLKISFGIIWCDFSTHSSLYKNKHNGKKELSHDSIARLNCALQLTKKRAVA